MKEVDQEKQEISIEVITNCQPLLPTLKGTEKIPIN